MPKCAAGSYYDIEKTFYSHRNNDGGIAGDVDCASKSTISATMTIPDAFGYVELTKIQLISNVVPTDIGSGLKYYASVMSVLGNVYRRDSYSGNYDILTRSYDIGYIGINYKSYSVSWFGNGYYGPGSEYYYYRCNMNTIMGNL